MLKGPGINNYLCEGKKINFHDLFREHKLCHGESPVGKAALVLIEIRYNVHTAQQNEDPDYDGLSTNDFVHFMNSEMVTISPGLQGHMFCSALQFSGKFKPLERRLKWTVTSPTEVKIFLETLKKCHVALVPIWNLGIFTILKQKGTTTEVLLLGGLLYEFSRESSRLLDKGVVVDGLSLASGIPRSWGVSYNICVADI